MGEIDTLFTKILKYNFNLCRGKESIPEFLKSHYNEYISDMEEAVRSENKLIEKEFIQKLKKNMRIIKKICKDIVDINEIYHDGNILEAYKKAYRLFNYASPYYMEPFYYDDYYKFYRIREGDFRIKSGEDSKKIKAELFHIKNDKRNLIGAYRYSVSGFPCLYLSTGFELSWFECGMPKEFSYCNMKFTNRHEIKLIDFTNRPDEVITAVKFDLLNLINCDSTEEKKKKEWVYEYLMKYIIIYPISIACSLKVEKRSDRFVEEYVFPQMFMQWIREKSQYDGVKYKSSLDTSLVDGMSACNIVLPVKKFREDGLCEELTSKIEISDIGYLNISDEFKKYNHILKEIEEFKNDIYIKGIERGFYPTYQYQIREICESIIVLYKALITENYKNLKLLFHQIDILDDYINNIYQDKENIINKEILKSKEYHENLNEEEIKKFINEDINKFHNLTSKIVIKNTAFRFERKDLQGWELI